MQRKQKMVKTSVKDLCGRKKDVLKFSDTVRGPQIAGLDMPSFIASFQFLGFQSVNLHRAIKHLKSNRHKKLLLAFTSNIISCGLRDTIQYLLPHCKAVLTTTGSIEEDIIKTENDFYVADFQKYKGIELYENGFCRIGNIVVADTAYVDFETYLRKKLDDMNGIFTTPEFVRNISPNCDGSFLFNANKLNVPVFVCGIGDGSIGDVCTFNRNKVNVQIDVVKDFHDFMDITKECVGLIVGDGAIRNRAALSQIDSFVHITTRERYDGSDFENTLKNSIRVIGDASIFLPLLIYGAYET